MTMDRSKYGREDLGSGTGPAGGEQTALCCQPVGPCWGWMYCTGFAPSHKPMFFMLPTEVNKRGTQETPFLLLVIIGIFFWGGVKAKRLYATFH